MKTPRWLRPRDLTQGAIASSVIGFAIPLLFTSIAQQLYSTVDLLFAGNALGAPAAAALGISMLLVTCIVGFLSGFSVGVNIVIARLFGAKDLDGMKRAVQTSLVTGIVGGIVLAVVGYAFTPVFIRLMATPTALVGESATYLHTYFITMVAVVLFNMAAAIARAQGDSVTPLLGQLVGGLFNIAANWLFVCVFDLGIRGIALATLISNGIAAVIVLVKLSRKDEPVPLRLNGLSVDGAILRQMLAAGIPIGVQSFVITLSNVFVQHQVDLLGTEAIAAFATYYKVELPIYYGIMAIGQAATTFVAQNHGAHDMPRVRRGAWVCQLLGLAVSAVMSVVMLLIGKWAFWIFVQDDQIIQIGLAIIHTTFPLYFIYSVLEVQGDIIRGLGRSVLPAVIILANICALRTVILFALTAEVVTVHAVAITYPITWTTTAVCMVLARLWVRHRMM